MTVVSSLPNSPWPVAGMRLRASSEHIVNGTSGTPTPIRASPSTAALIIDAAWAGRCAHGVHAVAMLNEGQVAARHHPASSLKAAGHAAVVAS
jgi:hypothetical protein